MGWGVRVATLSYKKDNMRTIRALTPFREGPQMDTCRLSFLVVSGGGRGRSGHLVKAPRRCMCTSMTCGDRLPVCRYQYMEWEHGLACPLEGEAEMNTT